MDFLGMIAVGGVGDLFGNDVGLRRRGDRLGRRAVVVGCGLLALGGLGRSLGRLVGRSGDVCRGFR